MHGRNKIALIEMALAVIAGVCLTADAVADPGVNTEVDLVSSYISHGKLVTRTPCLQPWVVVDSVITGLQFSAWASFALEEDQRRTDEVDYLLYYSLPLFCGEPWEVTFNSYFDYWVTPHSHAESGRDCDGFILKAQVAFPRILPIKSIFLVPMYRVYHLVPNPPGSARAGDIHEFHLSTALPLPVMRGLDAFRTLELNGNVAYFEHPYDIATGWSCAQANIAMPLNVLGSTLRPHAGYQLTWEDALSERDEFWAGVALVNKW